MYSSCFPDTIQTKLHMQKISTFALASSGPPYHIAGYVPGTKVTQFAGSKIDLYTSYFMQWRRNKWENAVRMLDCEDMTAVTLKTYLITKN